MPEPQEPFIGEDGRAAIDDDAVTQAAIRMRDEAENFSRPVHFYVRDEAKARWQQENEKDDWTEAPDGIDWELESWKILARAALGR